MKKNNAIVFGLTSNHVFAVACMMMGLKKFSPKLADEVVVIHDGINESDQLLLNSILPVRFIEYNFPLSKLTTDSRVVKQFTKMVFSKFECLRLLDDYRSVMWLDYDMVIQSDISELFENSGPGIKMMPGGIPVRGQLHADVNEFDMGVEGICGCIFVFQDHLASYMEMYDFCCVQAEKYADILLLGEQAIFDFMLQAFSLVPDVIDVKEYSPHPTDPVHAVNAKIIHAYGQPKFWNGLNDPRWEVNYKQWVRMGGSGRQVHTLRAKAKEQMLKISRLWS